MIIKADRSDKIFTGIIALVHVIFFLLACRYTRIYMGDSAEYIYEAINIKSLFFFYSGSPVLPITPEYMTMREPLYPLFLLVIYLFTVNNWIVIILQNILSIVNIYYARKLFISIGHQKKYDWMLLLFIIAYPAQFVNANTIAPDILLQTCTLTYFGNLLHLYRTKNVRFAVQASLALIAGFMVKPVLYPFVIPHIIIIAAAFYKSGLKVQRPLFASFIPLFTVVLFCYWNYTRTGKFHFSSNQAQNAVYYYSMYLASQHGSDSAAHFLSDERQQISYLRHFSDRYDYADDRGTALVEQHFAGYTWFHAKNSARILIEPGKAELDLFTGALSYENLLHGAQTGFYATIKTKGITGLGQYIRGNPSLPFILAILIFNCIRLLGLLLFFFAQDVSRHVRVLIGILICYFAALSGPIANTRYFLPVSLITIGAATLGFVSYLNKRKRLAT